MSEPEITAALEEVKRLDAEATPWDIFTLDSAPVLTVLNLCYTAFNCAKSPNDEDGGASDWFTDTLPKLRPLIEKMKAEHSDALARYRTLAPLLASELERVRKENAAQSLRLQECEKALRPFADVKVPEHAWDEDWGLADIGSGVDLLKAGQFRAAADYFQSRSKSEGEGRG